MSEKTEQPTAKRIRDAREEGQVAKSQEIAAVAQLGLILLWLVADGPALLRGLGGLMTSAVAVSSLPLQAALAQLVGEVAALML
ncbi:EscU/YscU/HrcU family type III secretion system export apparatus switch protein, partial [Klebsiella pneumoniae]|nr:EscU/YscU/HrcU family type III secretion system export apparatus switch protein [Klebsiella pneumoniae]